MFAIIQATCHCWPRCIGAYSAVRVLKGQQQIEIISFSPAWGIPTELHAAVGRASELCLNAQIQAVTLFEVLHTDGRSQQMTATIYAVTHRQYTNTGLTGGCDENVVSFIKMDES